METMEPLTPTNYQQNTDVEIKNMKDFKIKIDEEDYIVKLGKLDNSKKIVLKIEEQIDLTNGSYKSEFSLNELKSINKLFRIFDSIDEVYILFDEILNDKKIIIQKELDKINLHFTLTNLSSKTEDICLKIKKVNFNKKDMNELIIRELSSIKILLKEEKKNNIILKKIIDNLMEERNQMKNQIKELIEWKNSFKEEIKENENQLNFRIILIGLDAGGKTTILYQLKMRELVKAIPTIGFNVEEINYKEMNFTIWDVGGQDKIRVLWKHYYQNTDGVIFVVDSNDRDRIGEAAEEFEKILENEELKDSAILVMANKQDLKDSLSPGEITEKLGLKKIKGRIWFVQGTSAKNGEGLEEGLDWFVSVFKLREKE